MRTMELEKALQEYLQSGDSQLFLVSLSQHITAGHVEAVTSLLLQPQHKDVVKRLGWDLLSLITPHLVTPSPSSPVWQLVTAIAETCSPREMCLAFLEQLELVHSTTSPSLFFHLLTPLHTVLVRMGITGNGDRHVSSLRSVRSMLERVYPLLVEDKKGEEKEISPLTAADCVVELLEPFLTHIHHQFSSSAATLVTFWMPLQRECVGLLLTLLGDPLVSRDLQQDHMTTNTGRTVETIMSGVAQCHCGCLQLLEYEENSRPAQNEDTFPLSLPAVGVACFAYLVLVEGVQVSYLPSPLHPHHILHISLTHTLTLCHRPERHSVLKGLLLLEHVVHCVTVCSLPDHRLASERYLTTAECLVDLMVSCPHKQLRQRSVSLLPDLINRFPATCRHRIYRSLLLSSGHAGVQGLLIHYIKNEVDQALNGGAVSSPFLGSELIPVLHQVLTFSPELELLREADRVMAGLNFLRYLLLRDKPASNKTGVWDVTEKIRSGYIQPLRDSLESSKLQCRSEMEHSSAREHGGVSGDESEVSVEANSQQLPGIPADEQRKMLQLALHQLDMIECVLVRVEELIA